jgi:ubiquitin C-terminal hydrolase
MQSAIPLQRCLDKFTEQESLEGVVCPGCKKDDALKKSFALWRLPPVLVVQLKRFQFDSTSRRKLVDKVMSFTINGDAH